MDFLNTCFETTDSVRKMAYYSHLLPTVIALILAGTVFLFARNRDKAVLFFGFILTLIIWLIGNLITWTINDYYLVAAFWSPLDFVNILFFLFILLFATKDFSSNKRLFNITAILGGLACLPPFLITIAGLAVYEFYEPSCEMAGNDFLALYKLVFEFIVVFYISILGYLAYQRRQDHKERRRIILVTTSVVAFLVVFAGSEFLATYTEIYEINLYTLFTLPIFILMLAVSIFEFETFRLRIQSINLLRILFLVFIIVTIANLFVIDDIGEFAMTGTGALVTLGFGLMVWRGAKRESEQRKKIEKLAADLERVNTRLKILDKQKSEFVSIASHQLRSPLSSIRGYASMLLEGSYGKVVESMVIPLSRIEQASRYMAYSIEDYLNVSRIESGNMKFEYIDFNLPNEVEHICSDLSISAEEKGLEFSYRNETTGRGVVNLDIGKVIQIIQNVIQNSIKYTESGKIEVFLRDDLLKKKIYIEVIDTGIGMSQETLNNIFAKFTRAKNANTTDVYGTGLGLFVALRMAQMMDGNVTAYSEGEGQGAKFIIEFPLMM